MQKFNSKPALVTVLSMSRTHCETKEIFERLYGTKKTSYDSGNELVPVRTNNLYLFTIFFLVHIFLIFIFQTQVAQDESVDYLDRSIGEDLESYLLRTKTGEIYEEITEEGESKETFLSSLLEPDDELKLELNDEEFLKSLTNRNPDVPDSKMRASKSKMKYAMSECKRYTWIFKLK